MSNEKLNKETILDTIKKLLNVTQSRGATENEETNAMLMAQKLLMKHDLSMLDVEQHTLGSDKGGFNVTNDTYTASYTNPPIWVGALGKKISEGFDCRFLTSRGSRGATYHFVGLEVDAAVAKYLYLKLSDELYERAGVEGKKRGLSNSQIRNYRNTFIINAAAVIGMRLQEARQEFKRTVEKYGALVVRKEQLVEKFIADTWGVLQTRQRFYSGHSAGAADGQRAGREADLNVNKISGSGRRAHPQIGG